MRVFLLQAYLGRKDIALYPLGLSYIAARLNNYEVFALDPNLSSKPYEDIEKILRTHKPEVVGISLRNVDTLSFNDRFLYAKTLEPTLKLIRGIVPDAKIMLGGPGFSIYAQDLINALPEVDFGIYLEGEDSVPEILKNLSTPENVKGIYYRHNDKVIFTGIRENPDFRDIIPRRDLFVPSRYTHPLSIGVQTKRGCNLRCTYCNYPFLNGANLRVRDPHDIVDEIEKMVIDNRITHIIFTDAVFNIPKKHAVAICEEIIRRGLTIRWSAYFTEIGFDEEFMRLVKDSGCFLIFFSPDAYSNRSLKIMKKPIVQKDIKRIYKLTMKEKNINFDFCFFFNPPGQTLYSFLGLMWLAIKTNYLLPRRRHMRISLNNPRLEPHTELYCQALNEKSIQKETNLMPQNEDNLSLLFYKNPSSIYINNIMSYIYSAKKILKKITGIKNKKDFLD